MQLSRDSSCHGGDNSWLQPLLCCCCSLLSSPESSLPAWRDVFHTMCPIIYWLGTSWL